MADPHIRFDHVSKSYGSLTVVDDLVLDIAQGEFVSLLGPSGSGKTTLLMMLAGFETTSRGSVWLDGKRIDQLPPYRRNMGVVFQNYALFPHMTAADNVAFPLQMRGVSRQETAERVRRALDMVQLGAHRDKRPAQLSGGQQQRVALARALVFEPEVILMDEPLGALDKQLREQMQLDIRDLHRRLGLTIVFVTHDQSEALTMSDRIAVFNSGRIEQIGTPEDIYDRPRTRFVADFIGETNLRDATVRKVDGEEILLALQNGVLLRSAASSGLEAGQEVTVSIRPERLRLDESSGESNRFEGVVADRVYHGDYLRIMLDEAAGGFIVKTGRHGRPWSPGDKIVVSVAAADCWIIA